MKIHSCNSTLLFQVLLILQQILPIFSSVLCTWMSVEEVVEVYLYNNCQKHLTQVITLVYNIACAVWIVL